MYKYNAKLLNVVDGDTVDMDIDVGFNVKIKQRMRLKGINTPELHSQDLELRSKAIVAKEFVSATLIVGTSYVINTYKEDKYGRLLVDIYIKDSTTLNELLLTKGLAVPFMV